MQRVQVRLSGYCGASRFALLVLATVLSLSTTACEGIAFLAANAPAVFGPFHRVAEVSYGAGAHRKLDIYSPRGASNRPVVIFWHGGSWTGGSKSYYRFVGAALAERGFVTVLPDYRLYPEAKFPQFMDDGAQAVAWVQQHVREYGGDPERIVLMGHSAGAHMAAMLALNDTYLVNAGAQPRAIVGLVGLSGPYALDPNSDILRTIFSTPYTPLDWRPVRFVSDRSPPALLIQGLDDNVVAPSHTQELRDALAAHGIRVETELYAGKGHSDTIASFSLPARRRTPALAQSVAFMESVTAKSDRSH